MSDKTISVPLEHYLILAVLGMQYLAYLADKPDAERTLSERVDYPRFVRWEQWHDAADERGLTRL